MNCSFEGLFFLKVLYVIHAKSKEIKVNIDPRAEVDYIYTISDKARAVAGGVLEALLHGLSKGDKNGY